MAKPLIRSRTRKSSTLLPETLYAGLVKLAKVFVGGIVMLMAAIIAAALLSHSPQDLSFNTAYSSEEAVNMSNLCGSWGAYGSDIIYQIFGMSGFLFPVVLVAWGWRIVSGGNLEMVGWRGISTVVSAVSLSIAVGAFKLTQATNAIPLDGAIGRIVGARLASMLPEPWGMAVTAPFFFIASLGFLYLACALTIEEWHFLAQTVKQILSHLVEVVTSSFKSLFSCIMNRKECGEDEEYEDDAEDEPTPEDDPEEDEDEVAETAPPSASKARADRVKKAVKQPKKVAASNRQSRLALNDSSEPPLPPLDLLQWPESARQQATISEEMLEKNAKLLETVLDDFGVNGQILKVNPGPVVTLYELEPSPGTRAARVVSLADDIARNMSASSVRVAVVPGRNAIGIELPNSRRETVYLRELLSSGAYHDNKAALPLVLGKDIAGNSVITDLAKMPHLLIAGTTGSGKSVAINTMILSLLYRLPPQKCRFIMIDPKMLELSVYEGIPHLLAPVVTEPKKAIMALRWTVREMEERYRAMSKLGVRNIDGYNMRLRGAAKNGENLMRTVQTGFDKETGKPIYEEQPLDLTELPFIVVIVDEMADLMMVAGKEIEAAIQRLAQMARAAGIHIMMATQRPSVDVITGTIKANFPTRISFQVTSKIDSRTILGEQGAEQLLGQGDMLYMAGGGRVTRVHGPFVRDDEVEAIVKFLKAQGEPEYLDEVTEDDGSSVGGSGGGSDMFGMGEGSGDDLYDKAVDIVLRERKASTSFIQRQLQIGYNKAANLVERMEREGLIGPASATGKREIFGRNPNEE